MVPVPYIAMLVACFATVVVVWFDIWHASKTTFRFTGAAFGYGFLLLLGSAVATMLAWPILTKALAGRDQVVVEVIAGFSGVFGAQGLIRNMGVTLFGKEVLTFDAWVVKGRTHAVATQIKAAAAAETLADMKLARRLAATADLDTLVFAVLGAGASTDIEEKTAENKAQAGLVKAMRVIEGDRQKAAAFQATQPKESVWRRLLGRRKE